jgi:curved DNA-binding protein
LESPVIDTISVEEKNALTDAEAHEKILLTLYKKRRENAQNPGVLAFYIKESLNCSDEIFEFHAWYLKAKGFIERTEQNELAITVEGIDHVISVSRTSMAAKLLIAQADVQ